MRPGRFPASRSTGWWKSFAEIPTWHPAVDKVIPVAIRRWRKNLWQTIKSGEWERFKQRLRATPLRPGDRCPGPAEKRLADPLRQGPGSRPR